MRTKALQAASKEPMEKAQALQRAAASMPQPIGVAASLLSLQRSHGNQYVQRLLRSRRMQAKLTISEPGDQYEQEADRVAETVMRMPEPIGSEGVAVSGRVKDVHAQPVSSVDAEKLHRQTMDEEMEEEEEETLQAKVVSGETPEVTPELEARVNSARGGGQPLPESVRAFFEPRFGYDFGGVRVHTDGQAVDSARSAKARAYTLGQDIVFGSGQYAPETPAGKQLLAHELTHVVQQTGAMASTARHRSAGPLAPSAPLRPSQSGILERKCACGGAAGLSGECEECGNKSKLGLQTKLKVSEPGDVYEQEADSAAEAAVAGRPAHVAQHAVGPQLARQQLHTETLTTPTDAAARRVEVTRAVKAGKCAEVPDTRTNADTEITRTRATIELSYCRGRTSASAKGEIDYSDVTNTIRQAVNSAPNFLFNPNQQALSDLEQAFKRVAPRANVRFDLQIGGTKVEITGSGTASVEGGASGKAGATVSGRVGKTRVQGGIEVSGGTQEEEKVIFTGTLGGGAPEIPNCFKCVCKDPTITFACVVHEPGTPTQPPQSRPILYVPLFFEYEKTIPRTGWEKDYEKVLGGIIERLQEGYTIAGIEGRTSPEGPLKLKQGRKDGFEGNIKLAQDRAVEAQKDLQAALNGAIGKEDLKVRDFNPDTIRRLKAARSAAYEVKGLAPGREAASAELFGTGGKGEVTEREMLNHLKKTLKKPAEGEPDPLAEEHVIGEGLPPDVRAEVEAEVEAFRTGKRGGKTLKDRELLETIYRPLRRALIVLNPPPAKPFLVGTQLSKEELQKVVGKPLDQCLPEHEVVFTGKTIPNDQLYEGECRPKGGVKGKVK